MDEEELDGALMVLYVAKLLYEHDNLDQLFEKLGDNIEVSWDNQYLVGECACECVFQDTRVYYHESKYVSPTKYLPDRAVFVLRDPLLNRFHALCCEYEKRTGVLRNRNLYVHRLENAIHSVMSFPAYDYDYFWDDGTGSRKPPKLVVLLFEEFFEFESLVGALCTILDALEEQIADLVRELENLTTKVIPLPPPYEQKSKEAA